MKIYRLFAFVCLLFALGMPLASKSVAGTVLKCPECGMPMPTTKTAMMTSPIKINGTVYYCCAGCPAGVKASTYRKAHHGHLLSIKVPAAKM